MNTLLLVMTLLACKHFVIDFMLQDGYQLNGKGIYGHPGGLLHSGLHGCGTAFAFMLLLSPIETLTVALADAITHYHIDWAKVKITVWSGAPFNGDLWWRLFGLDQLLHALTYIALTWWALT